MLRWLSGGKGFDQPPRPGCLDQALVMTGSGVIQQGGLCVIQKMRCDPEALAAAHVGASKTSSDFRSMASAALLIRGLAEIAG